MFTGIISAIGYCILEGSKLSIFTDNKAFFENLKIGDSVSVNGVCLTVTCIVETTMTFFVMEETLKYVTFKGFVNLERAAKLNDDNSGHLISGHINLSGTIIEITENQDTSKNIWIETNIKVKHKGCISVNGVSLTIAEVKDNIFRCSLIPHTINNTTFKFSCIGDIVNIEYEIITKNLVNFMDRALFLAEKGRYTTYPNPWVGCVIVKDGVIIGEGYHEKCGGDHAERIAIKDAITKGNEKLIKNSTVYVTLEPCHHHGRTPPCDQMLIDYKVERVVIGCVDPDEKVSSKGIDYLKKAGIKIEVAEHVGVKESLKAYLHQRKYNLPYCILKAAVSIDGCIATSSGDSKWISSNASRVNVQHLRAQSHAILVGVNTILKDNPELNVRIPTLANQPLRVILDTKNKLNNTNFKIFNIKDSPTIIFTSTEPKYKIPGVEYIVVKAKEEKVDLKEVLHYLSQRGILQCLVEGGAEVFTSFIKEGLAQEVYIYKSNLNIGGKKWLNISYESICESDRWSLVDVKRFNNDLLCIYKI